MTDHASAAQLAVGWEHVLTSPTASGVVTWLVRRPQIEDREVCEVLSLDPDTGVEGDCWQSRGSRHTDGNVADPERQLTIMNIHAAMAVAGDRQRIALAGDQVYVEFDLSIAALPAGTRLAMGDVVVEVSDAPHRGCVKFSQRFGPDSLRWVNSPEGAAQRLRGLNARIIVGGQLRLGDSIHRVTNA